MAVRRRRAGELADDQRRALRERVAAPKFELIPIKGAEEHGSVLPPGSTVTITASPSHGIEATVELAIRMMSHGHVAVPHLSAHMFRGRDHLSEVVTACAEAGITRAFVVGGDAKDRGEIHDGLALLHAMDELGHPFAEIGVPCYPEGHIDIADSVLLDALREKQRYASYMTTQMCFNPGAIVTWVGRMRDAGVTLPVHVGAPGVAEITKLMKISTRIGVADSARYLKKNRKMVGHLLTPGRFGPDALLEGLAPTFCDPRARLDRIHLFTFNQVEDTVAWQARMLASLDAAEG
jgi:methylenetetrahydrofolate reductase (NADPH)